MADIICRWRNPKPSTIVELVNSMPHKEMDSSSFRQYMENSELGNVFLRTAYQLACQLGLYYDDGETFHPRFNNDITEEDAIVYLQKWIHKYYVPNPYTMSIKAVDTPILLLKSIVKELEEKNNRNLKDVLESIFKQPMGNLDIIINLLNGYSNVISIDKSNIATLKENYKEHMDRVDRNDKKEFFHWFDNLVNTSDSEHGYSHQVIYYGAPGTGKSFQVKELTRGENVFRTTFHPDSDYSTFVGCYKPTMKGEERILSKEELKVVLPKNGKETYACQKFATRYWRSLNQLTTKEIEEILVSHGYTTTMCLEIKKGIAVGEEMEKQHKGMIVYEFIPQAFLKAYVQAWNYYAQATQEEGKITKQFLVIEEINRGNCAQIFGDLFQLLDRNEAGFSDYYINADNDIKAHLKNAFKEINEDAFLHKDKINAIYNKGVSSQKEVDIVNKVLSGEILLLPNNFFIWATMNTSDQSLFPIDSAFKRRWDWVYVPIADVQEKNWKIVIADRTYGWWNFLEKINEYIGSITNSEDKKLGFFFCQAKNDEVIDADMFVSKVLFYLWNDVFKDYGFESDLFKIEDNQLLTFDKFYKPINGKTEVNLDNVKKFLENLKVETKEQVASETPKEQSIENEITPNE